MGLKSEMKLLGNEQTRGMRGGGGGGGSVDFKQARKLEMASRLVSSL